MSCKACPDHCPESEQLELTLGERIYIAFGVMVYGLLAGCLLGSGLRLIIQSHDPQKAFGGGLLMIVGIFCIYGSFEAAKQEAEDLRLTESDY